MTDKNNDKYQLLGKLAINIVSIPILYTNFVALEKIDLTTLSCCYVGLLNIHFNRSLTLILLVGCFTYHAINRVEILNRGNAGHSMCLLNNVGTLISITAELNLIHRLYSLRQGCHYHFSLTNDGSITSWRNFFTFLFILLSIMHADFHILDYFSVFKGVFVAAYWL